MDPIEALAKALYPALAAQAADKGVGWKHDASGTPISSGYSHGPGGQLTFPGVDPALFHTIVGNRGIIGQLPAVPSVLTNPTFYVITGVRDVTGSEKDTVCEDAPVAGLMKGGKITSVFGRYERSTPELELNRLGQRNDRADPMDLSLVGSPMAATGPFSNGPGNPNVPGDMLTNEISRKMWELGISFHRLLATQLWTGDPANNSAGEGYKEMTGFEQLVITGHVDAETNLSLPSLDADLVSFAYANVADSGSALVDALAYMYMTRKDLAERTGMTPVRWVFAMRQELFWEITKIWPCSYLSYQCNLTGNAQLQINAADQVRMRDELRAGKYLMINGDRIEVVIDDGIPFTTNTTDANVTSGCFASDIYLIPMSVTGGRAVTFLEYADYSNASLSDAFALGDGGVRVLGPWLVAFARKIWCVKWQAKIEPRLIMRTPWLSGRLQNVMFCPTENARQPFPSDPYFTNGGESSRPGPSFYTPW